MLEQSNKTLTLLKHLFVSILFPMKVGWNSEFGTMHRKSTPTFNEASMLERKHKGDLRSRISSIKQNDHQ